MELQQVLQVLETLLTLLVGGLALYFKYSTKESK